MPELSLTETILGVIAALGTGGTVAMARRRPDPGTPEDHEQRMADLERHRTEMVSRLTTMETRMSSTETQIAAAIGRLTESSDRIWRVIEAAGEKIDKLHDTVVRLDVESTVDREIRRHERARRTQQEGSK